jgi:hypothetical protein
MVGVIKTTSNRSKGAGQLMIRIFLIALAAGCASALMFASIISGALISVLLFYLAPLPLMVAAIGWGPLSAVIGGGGAAAVLFAVFGLPYCAAYAITVALPACWLGHLALLGRPVASASSDDGKTETNLEWYPVGRLLLWTAGFATVASFAALLTIGTDAAVITDSLRSFLLRVLNPQDTPLSSETEQWIDMFVASAPPAAATVSMTTLTLNLWLSGKITATSGRLQRPWPDLKGAALPPITLVALCVAIALCFSDGLIAFLGKIVASVLMVAFALTGFAVLHTLTLALKARAFWLGSTYTMVILFVWPVLAMALLGIADALFGFRARYLRSRPPPLPAR